MMVLIPFDLQSKQHHHDQASKIHSVTMLMLGPSTFLEDEEEDEDENFTETCHKAYGRKQN